MGIITLILIFILIFILIKIKVKNKYIQYDRKIKYGVNPRTGEKIEKHYLEKTNNSIGNLNNKNEEINRYKSWKATTLFTNEELKFYKELFSYLKTKNVFLLSKVRLADLVKPKIKLNNSDFMKTFLKLSQKHIDYVITDYNGQILCIIELDGKSHTYGITKKNDLFKNTFFETLNIPLLRFYNYSYHNLSKIDKYLTN